jgi:hypothetical protein
MSTNLLNQSWLATIPRLLAVALVAAVIVAIMWVATRPSPTGRPSAPRSPQPQAGKPARWIDSPQTIVAGVGVLLILLTHADPWWWFPLIGVLLTIKYLPNLAVGTLGRMIAAGGMMLLLLIVAASWVFFRLAPSPRGEILVYHNSSGGTTKVMLTSGEINTMKAGEKTNLSIGKAEPAINDKTERPKGQEKAVKTPMAKAEDNAARPKWVDAPDAYVGTVYEMTVMSGPFTDDLHCVEAMPREIQARIEKYVAEVYRDGQGPGAVSISMESLLAELPQLITAKYQETRNTSVGPMRVHYAQLSFGETVNRWIDGNLRDITIRRRIEYLGTGITGVLAALGVAWVCLKRAVGQAANQTLTVNKA